MEYGTFGEKSNGWHSVSIEEFDELLLSNDVTPHTLPSDLHIVIYYDREAYDRGEIQPVAKVKCKATYSDWNEYYAFG